MPVFLPGVDYHLTIAMVSFVISVKFKILFLMGTPNYKALP